MKLMKEISYTDVLQRKIIYTNSFISYCILSALYFDFAHLLFSLDIYNSYFKILFITTSSALLLGNGVGMYLFRKFSSRSIYITVEIAFFMIAVVFLARGVIDKTANNLISEMFFSHSTMLPCIFAIVPFILGIKTNYFLKIACGNFIDDKRGAIPFILAIITGAALGIGLFAVISIFRDYSFASALIAIPIFPSIFLIKLSYSLPPQFAQETNEGVDVKQEEPNYRDDIYFTFLNFSCMLIYILLGYKIVEKNYGNLFHIQVLFVLITIFAFVIGFFIAKLIKNAFWFIYSEMLFPVAFLVFIAVVYLHYHDNYYYIKMLFFSIPSAVFGFSFYKTMNIIMTHYNHGKRFNILNYSLFVLPIPIIIALGFIEFTSLLFFSFLYIIMLINTILPGIHLLQSNINNYKKIIYFIFSLIFIPSIYVFHRYLGIPFNNDLFVNHVTGYQLLYNNKYNSLYIQNNSNVLSHGNIIFINNDGAIRNLKKILIPIKIFAGDEKNKQTVLFIDGNRKFFRNSAISYFNDFHVLDYLPERSVDFNVLPLSGNQQYVVDKNNLIKFINTQQEKYNIIVDMPNILDQGYYSLRFDKKYFDKIKNSMNSDGIFAQVYNLNQIKREYLSSAIDNFKNYYKKVIGFQCADQLIVMGSDDDKRFEIKENNYNIIKDLFIKNSEMVYLFYNEEHLLSHCLFSGIEKFKFEKLPGKDNIVTDYCFNDRVKLSDSIKNQYLTSGTEILSLIPEDTENMIFKRKIQNELIRNGELFALLKTSELAGVDREFDKEAEILSLIEKKFSYREDLKKYIYQIFSMKKEFYFNTAIELEKEKKWDEAKKLYSSIIKIDSTHFDANYRMGLLFITLQNMTDALVYMQQAMKLKNDDPRVQYQMGVLLFSSGKAQDALKYLDRAVELKQDNASLYLHIGFCYEELGKYLDAKNYYQKALLKDPNDGNIILSIDRINVKMQEEADKWKTKDPENQNEAEQGENIPLPINKSAYEWRITDQEAKRLKGTQ